MTGKVGVGAVSRFKDVGGVIVGSVKVGGSTYVRIAALM
jgi:hypothetical protein